MKILRILTEAVSELSNVLEPMAILLFIVVCVITSIQMHFCLPCLQLVKSCLHAASVLVQGRCRSALLSAFQCDFSSSYLCRGLFSSLIRAAGWSCAISKERW